MLASRSLFFRTQLLTGRRLLCTATTNNVQNSNSNDLKLKVLYDGKCPLCVWEIDILKKFDLKREQAVNWVDISKDGFLSEEHKNISYQEAMDEMHVITDQGEVLRKTEAFRAMYGAVGLGWVFGYSRFPGMEYLSDKVYMWFARNRLRWTGRDCESGSCNTKK